jgi:hypothetical protein
VVSQAHSKCQELLEQEQELEQVLQVQLVHNNQIHLLVAWEVSVVWV